MCAVETRWEVGPVAANWGPLRAMLDGANTLTLHWDQLDRLVDGLPASATNHSAFWSGERSTWPGFRTTDVVVGKSVTFVRIDGAPAKRSAARPVTATSPVIAGQHARSSDAADLVLIGCVKEKLDHPAAAHDLYISPLFAKERTYAEASGAPWFILSAEHGLVAPEEVLAPYNLKLSSTTADYRRAWGTRVVDRLVDVAGPLHGKRIEVHAGSAYIDPIRSLLGQHGATVLEPLAGLKLGPRLAWYKNGGLIGAQALSDKRAGSSVTDAAAYVRALRDEGTALTPTDFLATNGAGLRSPGLYSWWVDPVGAADLTRGVGHQIKPGMIYAGLAGATRERSGRQSSNTLWLRIMGMHLGGKHEFSTLRLTLGSSLAEGLGWGEIDEAKLSEWMHAHLRVLAIPVPDADALGKLESVALDELDPPLNLSKVAKTDVRRRLTELRRRYSRKRRRPRPAT